MDSLKKVGTVAGLSAALLAGQSAQAENYSEQKENAPQEQVSSVQEGPEVPNALWNGLKKFCGLPYQETEYWNKDESLSTHGVKSTAERALWGMWTYQESEYSQEGNREETRYYKGNDEIRRNEFHKTGTKSWTGEIKDGHPFGRVKGYDPAGNQAFEGVYDLEGQPDGVHKEFKDGILTHETSYQHGVRYGEERIYNPKTGSLQKTIPWDNGKKNGVEHNLENGDFITYHDNVRDGSFKETTGVKDGYKIGLVERSGFYDNGKAHVLKESTFDNDGKLKKEVSYDENGERHGEERVDNGVGYDVTPYHHGTIDGIQTLRDGFVTWKNGVREGAYETSSTLLADEDLNPVILAHESGVYENGERNPKETRYGRMTYEKDGSVSYTDLTAEQAQEAVKKATTSHAPEGMKGILAKSSSEITTPTVNTETKQNGSIAETIMNNLSPDR